MSAWPRGAQLFSGPRAPPRAPQARRAHSTERSRRSDDLGIWISYDSVL